MFVNKGVLVVVDNEVVVRGRGSREHGRQKKRKKEEKGLSLAAWYNFVNHP